MLGDANRFARAGQIAGVPLAREARATLIAEIGASGIKDMGRTMAALKERYAGQMDFTKASALVKEALTGAG